MSTAEIGIKSTHKDTLRSFSKTAGNILFAVLLMLGVLMSSYLLGQKFLPKSTSAVSSYKMLIVLSGSMSPEFDPGSVVFVKNIAPADIKIGDIVTFRSSPENPNQVTHRVVDITRDGELAFTTKGDANETPDPEQIYSENIVGKVHFSIPYVGYALNFAKTKLGMYFMVVLPGILIILYEIFKIFGYMNSRKKEQGMKAEAVIPVKTEEVPMQTLIAETISETIEAEDRLFEGSKSERLFADAGQGTESRSFEIIGKIESELKEIQDQVEGALHSGSESALEIIEEEKPDKTKLRNYRNELQLILEQY